MCKRLVEDVKGYVKFVNEFLFKVLEVKFNVIEDEIEKDVNVFYGSFSLDFGFN